jgi:hypothetical protein
MEFGQQFRDFSNRVGFFYMPQSLDMGQIILLPHPKEGMLWIFPVGKIHSMPFQQEISDGFVRERTRDVGYQQPAC